MARAIQFNTTPAQRIQRPVSKDEMFALVEGDVLIEPKLGYLVYTEQSGEKRLIRQLNMSEILSVNLDEDRRNRYEVNSDGTISVKTGERISIFGDYSWVQYDTDQKILERAGI